MHFGNHFALEGVSKKKSDICRSIGAEVLIDDNPSYAVECAQVRRGLPLITVCPSVPVLVHVLVWQGRQERVWREGVGKER